MMAEHAKPEGLFYDFKLADHVRRTNLPRLIARHGLFNIEPDIANNQL